jgi:tyrosine-protein kinase Etk/Wzc
VRGVSFTSPARALTRALRGSWAAPYIDHVAAKWRTVLAYAFLAGIAGAATALLLPKVYVSRASLVPDTPDLPSISGPLAQVAGQFGLMGLTGNRTPDFYRDLLHSRRVLSELAMTSIIDPLSGKPQPIYRIYSAGRIDSLTPRNTERIVQALDRRLGTTLDLRTGVIRVSLGGPGAAQAAETLDSLLSLTNRFAVTNLRSRARARRQFAEEQTDKARLALQVAEDSLRRFYEHNRRLTDSPNLQFEEASLRRRVDLRQELYLGLSRDLESARIEEVRNTPILIVIDPPIAPNRHERPNRRALTILAALFGGFVAVCGLVIERANAPKP